MSPSRIASQFRVFVLDWWDRLRHPPEFDCTCQEVHPCPVCGRRFIPTNPCQTMVVDLSTYTYSPMMVCWRKSCRQAAEVANAEETWTNMMQHLGIDIRDS